MLKLSLIPLLCMIAVVAAGISNKGRKNTLSRRKSSGIGGNPISTDDYSFIASIRIAPLEIHKCGGFLISVNHIITTASCIFSARDKELHAYLNPISLDNLGLYYPVQNVNIHPNFTLSPQENDIAVAVLSKSVEVAPKHIPVIPDWVNIPMKTDVLSFSWAYDKINMGIGNFSLHTFNLKVMSNGLCSLVLREYIKCEILCAASPTEKFATVPADVGTPLIYRDNNTDTIYAVGILIKETEEMVNAAPYLKLRNYISWANEIMKEMAVTTVASTKLTSEINMEGSTTPTTENDLITLGTESDEDYVSEEPFSESRMNRFGSRRNQNEPSARRQLRNSFHHE